jgi:two-component system, chemotaxis family, response regulator Rcp1
MSAEGDATRPAEVLLVDDNAADVRMISEILLAGRVPKVLRTARDGEEALALLRRAADGDGALPDLVLLDLNLPRRDGREVLAALRAEPRLYLIPVVVFTTSEAEADIVRTYELRVNAYVIKPVGLDAFAAAVQMIEAFWLGLARLPRGNRDRHPW